MSVRRPKENPAVAKLKASPLWSSQENFTTSDFAKIASISNTRAAQLLKCEMENQVVKVAPRGGTGSGRAGVRYKRKADSWLSRAWVCLL